MVLLVHGWEGRGAQLGAFVDPFVAAGYRVVALDGPAHGDSTGAHHHRAPEFAAAIAVTRDAIGPLAAIVAHSFGGFTSLLAVARGLSVDRLVVIGTPSSVPEVLREFQELIHLPERALPPMVRALEQRVGASMESFDISTFADRITVPVLVVHDTDDVEVPYVNGTRLSELFGAPLITTSGLGHRRILFAPDVVSAVVEFVETGRCACATFRSGTGAILRAIRVHETGGPETLQIETVRRSGAGSGRGARPPRGDRRQLHRDLSAEGHLQAPDAVRPRRGRGGHGRGRRTGRGGRCVSAIGWPR